ncbi:MAG: pseudaminic acid synthase [Pseudomonadota bacterium]|jgi:pseudaminic acid synthase
MSDMPCLHIAGRRIAADEPPYVIAELSANHNGSLDHAIALIDAAHAAGADAIKLQTYTPDTITLDLDTDDFMIRGGPWDGRRLHDLYREAHTPWDWHPALFEHARRIGITIFSSPFDATAVDLLERLGAPAYKIASFEAVDIPLIRRVAATGKPLIISTGMADEREIGEALDAAYGAGAREVALLRCVSGYPAAAADYHLRTIPDMIERFGTVTGLSDHTLDDATAVASVALGAALVEKHFTLDRRDGGPDAGFSLEPAEFGRLCRAVRTAWDSLGRIDYGRKPSEQANVAFRRSLYFVRALSAGELVTPDAVRSIRPGHGLAPKHLDAVIGRVLAADVAVGTPVRAELLIGFDTKATMTHPTAYRTEQESFWAGSFGTEYIERNQDDSLLAANLAFFSKALARAGAIDDAIEFGANVGMNLRALRQLRPGIALDGIEINPAAADRLEQVLTPERVHRGSMLEFEPSRRWDLVMAKGVLIHIAPSCLPDLYDRLVRACGRYLLIAEYYNPTPVALNYRGHTDRLYKRDFAGELMDRHPQMSLVDYGFVWRRDPVAPQDDITWFLLERR